MSAGGGYENAPATLMLATSCACCGRPLLDSVSVETGIGPDCRRKHGFNVVVGPEARTEANKIVHAIALEGGGLLVAQSCARLRELGFEKLAGVIENRACPVRITEEGGQLVVATPFNEVATGLFRRIPGRHWHGKDCACGRDVGANKVNVFPSTSRRQLFEALVMVFSGLVAVGPKGPFVIGPAPVAANTNRAAAPGLQAAA